jgi:NAD(P)-dependent dehydrogenase (short-subunit alcohol dehydrogenase family)
MMRRFEGRRALVTGAGSGIGRAVAVRLASEGADVAVSGRRPGPLEETAAAIERAGARAVVVPGDLAVEADAARVVDGAVAGLEGLDIVVNSAGTIRRGRLAHELPAGSFDAQIGDNLRSVFLVTGAALAHMRAGDGDRAIVNIASTLAHTPGSGVSAYVASKGAVVSFTRAVAHEYASAGIRANCVCPGTVRTPMAYAERPDFDEMSAALEAFYPLGRLGEPDDVAGAVAYLASGDARWVTGVVLDVDGGLSVR